jgi:hypothetical protein
MPLANYTELKTAIADFAVRSDLTTQMDTFIALAEEAIYNGVGDIAPLRTTGMQLSVTSGLPTLPSDFLEAIRLTTTSNGYTSVVEYRTPEQFAEIRNFGAVAQFFTILNGQLLTVPTIGTYEFHYYKRFAALSAGASTNWILTNGPSVYLHGSLMALYKMTRDADREQASMRDFGIAMKALQRRDDVARHSGGALVAVPAVSVI